MLNAMMDQFSIDRDLIYRVNRNQFTLIPGQRSYTLGTGGDWSIDRPVRIDRAGAVVQPSATYPVEVPLGIADSNGWAAVGTKTITSSIPQLIYPTNSFPLDTVWVWPIYDGVQACDIALYTWSLLSQFADLNTTDYTFPQGYDMAIRFSLAEFLWPSFVGMSKTASNGMTLPMIQKMAKQARNALTPINAPRSMLHVDRALQNRQYSYFDARTNEYLP